MAPEPLRSAPAAPPPGRGQDCHFGGKNSVCNNNVPTAVDNPPPRPPAGPGGFLKHDLLQKAVQPWPGPGPSAWTPRTTWQYLEFGRLKQSGQALLPGMRCPEHHLGALGMSLPSLSSPPSAGSPSDPREPLSQERVRGGPLLAGTWRESSPQKPGDPLFCRHFQTQAVPRAVRPHILSLLQALAQVPLGPSAQ